MATEQSFPPPPSAAHLAEASGELVAMSFPGARRVAGWLFWVVFPLLCLATVVFAAVSIGSHIGRRPEGVSGTYLANRTCVHGICLISGTFVSDDGRLKVESLLGDPRWKPGQLHHVLYDSKNVEVIAQPGHWDPTPYAVAAAGALTYLGVVGRLAVTGRRERAAPTGRPTGPAPA